MVKKGSRRTGRKVGTIVWLSRELEYRAGLPIADIAARHGVQESSVRKWATHRKWTVHLAPSERVSKRLCLEIARAERALVDGDVADAQKRVQAASALARATRTLAQLQRDAADSGQGNRKGKKDMNEHKDDGGAKVRDFRAELERCLLRIIDTAESKSISQGVASSDQSGASTSTS